MSIGEPSQSYRKTKIGGPRGFGFVFAVVFAVVGLLPLISRGAPHRWALILAALFMLAAIFVPRALQPFNIVWFRLGLLLHAIINPLVMSLIFWISVVPVALVARMAGKDFLRLKRDPKAQSYWISREPAGPEDGSMTRQF